MLDAFLDLRRLGTSRAFEQLEDAEPELTEYVMETLAGVHRQLLALGAPARQSQRVFREVQSLVLTVITALRIAARNEGEPALSDDDAPADDTA